MKRKIKITILCVILLFVIMLIMTGKTVFAADTAGLTNYYVYNIINRNSGKYLNVNYGTDANGTNVNQYTGDGSPEQKFTLHWWKGDGIYKIYPLCSDSRALDVYRPLQNNSNVDIWEDNDDDAQLWKIEKLSNGYYVIRLAYNTSLALTAYGTANGGGSGTSSTSAGNVFVSTYTGAANQQWSFSRTPALLTWDLVASDKHLYWTGTTKYSSQFATAVSNWNAVRPGLIVETHVHADRATISDFYEANSGVVGQTSSGGTIKFNTYYMDGYSTDRRINCCVHELGHALRLDHMKDASSVMYYSNSTTNKPNSQDIWNLNQAYLYY